MIQKLLQFEGVAGVLWRAASAVLLGWGLTACGNQTREVRVVPAPAGPQIVSVYTFDEYTDLELLKEFTARTGIHVDLKFYDETDEMVENLKSNPGEYDIFLTEDGYIQLLAAKRMMKPSDQRPTNSRIRARLLGRRCNTKNSNGTVR